jgi:hypothetical protein
MSARRSGFWSGIGAGVALEAATWMLFLLGAAAVTALDLPWGWNIAIGVALVVAIVIGLWRHGRGGGERN